MTQDLELRVLTGIHDGARCPAQDGVLIGSHADCDVVLCDDGIAQAAARLWVGATAWCLYPPDGAVDTAQAVRFGTPLSLGPILLTIAPAAAPWPDPGAIFAVPESDGQASDASGRSRMPDAETTETQAGSGAGPDSSRAAEQRHAGPHPAAGGYALRAHAPRRRKGLGLRWAVGGLLILLVFGSVASFPPSKGPSPPRVQSGPATESETLARAHRVLAEQGYAPRVHASLNAEQEVVITGWVHDDLEHDRLATALSTIWPLPCMRVGKETALQARINTRMQGLDVRVAIESPQPAELAIRGIAASEAIRHQAYAQWREDADMSSQTAMKLLLATDVADSLNQAVAAAGLPAVASAWKDKALRIDARGLDSLQRERLKTVLDALNPIYLNALLVDGEQPGPADSVPFRVHTVVGGQQPWVVLDDGTRIVLGGTHGAYQLTSIEDGSVIFDGPTTAVISR